MTRRQVAIESAVVVLLLCIGVSPAPAVDRFVSSAGTDTANDCSNSATPCATMTHALSQASSGDTIKVAEGTYADFPLIDSSTTLSIVGGWDPAFSASDSKAAKKTIITVPAVLEARAGEAIEVSFDRFTFATAPDDIPAAVGARAFDDGSVTLSVSESFFQRDLRGLFVFADDTGTVDFSFTDSVIAKSKGRGAEVHARNSSSVTGAFTGCQLTGNNGGIFARANDSSKVRLTLADSTIKGNKGNTSFPLISGGGLEALTSENGFMEVGVNRTVFSSNKTNKNLFFEPSFGGGVLAQAIESSTLYFTADASTFRGNKSSFGGGAQFQAGQSNPAAGGTLFVTLTNSFFLKNGVSDFGPIHSFGGGIRFLATETGNLTADVVNCTVTGNKGTNGGGMHAVASSSGSDTVTLKNVIVYGNKVKENGADVRIDAISGASTVVNADHDDLGQVYNNPSQPGTFNDLGGNISAPPLLKKNMFLTAGSPAIDAGTCSGAPAVDFEGDTRPSGAGCDIGADEFVP